MIEWIKEVYQWFLGRKKAKQEKVEKEAEIEAERAKKRKERQVEDEKMYRVIIQALKGDKFDLKHERIDKCTYSLNLEGAEIYIDVYYDQEVKVNGVLLDISRDMFSDLERELLSAIRRAHKKERERVIKKLEKA